MTNPDIYVVQDWPQILNDIVYRDQVNDAISNCSRSVDTQVELLSRALGNWEVEEPIDILEIGCGVGNTLSAMLKLNYSIGEISAFEMNPQCACAVNSNPEIANARFSLIAEKYIPGAVLPARTYLRSSPLLIVLVHDLVMSWTAEDISRLMSDLRRVSLGRQVFVLVEQIASDLRELANRSVTRTISVSGLEITETSEYSATQQSTVDERYCATIADTSQRFEVTTIMSTYDVDQLHEDKGYKIVSRHRYPSLFSFAEFVVDRELILFQILA